MPKQLEIGAQPPASSVPSADFVRKRKHERIGLDVPLIVRLGEGRLIAGRTLDISEGGLGAVLRHICEPGQVVEVKLALENGAVPLHIRSVIKYSSPVRHGFEFLAVSDGQRAAIARLVAAGKKRTAQTDSQPICQPFKFGGKHAPDCACPICGRCGGAHSSDCMCDACGGFGGEHNASCRCPACGKPPREHSEDCSCPRCHTRG